MEDYINTKKSKRDKDEAMSHANEMMDGSRSIRVDSETRSRVNNNPSKIKKKYRNTMDVIVENSIHAQEEKDGSVIIDENDLD